MVSLVVRTILLVGRAVFVVSDAGVVHELVITLRVGYKDKTSLPRSGG
jgi:hypothetical protein